MLHVGKRNLNWNLKPQRWKERNIRRGASASLRAIVPQLKDGDARAEDDSRLKYLASRGKFTLVTKDSISLPLLS